MLPLCLCQQVENQQTMTTVHCRQTSRDVNGDVLDNKLAGFVPADFFPWHARVHFDMLPRSPDGSIFETAWPQACAGKRTSVASQLTGGRQVSFFIQRATNGHFNCRSAGHGPGDSHRQTIVHALKKCVASR